MDYEATSAKASVQPLALRPLLLAGSLAHRRPGGLDAVMHGHLNLK